MTDKATPLGDRVYQKHRDMLKKLAKKRKHKTAQVLRAAIENEFARG